ncbi:hypothetical protein IFM61606_08773 [Aspergillus udagawae]|uniref:Uncharacterized protein n=1 Tax=Aspergillus udagawae TaxID=91492 RepID=A0ABQ1BEB4_9EURO|nr:hypothetical protein IFM61606_08773 [Aspergillus udagawae]GFF99847.1 hypothetical protein IFM53868_10486 [Aspergillus udagawae]GFG19206.1 hypothetical protein IFM5058_09822 [Aspergillus udagawae]
MSRSGRHHDFNSQRAILDRRVSDSDYDYDTKKPHKAQPSSRREPSYFGPNFQNSEKKRSSSLAGGDIRHPPMPDPFVKRPHPYPQSVKEEHDAYKARDLEYATAKKAASAANAVAGGKRSDPLFREKALRGVEANASARVAANTVAAYRSGFGHKYPYAYESPEKVIEHHDKAIEYKNNGARWRKKEQGLRKQLQ